MPPARKKKAAVRTAPLPPQDACLDADTHRMSPETPAVDHRVIREDQEHFNPLNTSSDGTDWDVDPSEEKEDLDTATPSQVFSATRLQPCLVRFI